MRKFLVLSSWSRKAIGSMIFLVALLVACSEEGNISVVSDDDPVAEFSSSSVERGVSSGGKNDGQNEVTSSSGSKISVSSSSSVGKVNCSALLEGETGWSWDVPKECRFNPDIDYGTMTDERDGKVYKTVKIGDQTWMAENLNYAYTGVSFNHIYYGVYTSDSTSWCYNNEAANCEVTGRLYTWAAAIDSVKLANDADNPQECGYNRICTLPAKLQGICPTGWHLPSEAEWETLFKEVGGRNTAAKVLKSRSGWNKNGNGTDAYGFSALPACGRGYSGGFNDEGDYACFWSPIESVGSLAFSMDLHYDNDWAFLVRGDKDYGFSVRCLKDDLNTQMQSSSSSVRSESSSSVVDIQSSSSEDLELAEGSSSSSSVKSSSSFEWSLPKEAYLNPDIDYGTMTDERDGKVYKTVKIDGQTWMAENLNFDPGQGGSGEDKYDWSWCYNNESKNCDVAGRLYTWAAAMDSVTTGCGNYGSTCSPPTLPVQGICPTGWHLPSYAEWALLGGNTTAVRSLKSLSGWEGNCNCTDVYGFSALPAGNRDTIGRFNDGGYYAYFWSSAELGSLTAYYLYLHNSVGITFKDDNYKSFGYSVRCVKNE
ncbi:MAG: fibrobacter succinogenes major paralogous domain-containing protein [Fibrobacter sp.]|nr:fibrobacter succinogenes major paralogous domain-containing protein [Fibrobacter sp.]